MNEITAVLYHLLVTLGKSTKVPNLSHSSHSDHYLLFWPCYPLCLRPAANSHDSESFHSVYIEKNVCMLEYWLFRFYSVVKYNLKSTTFEEKYWSNVYSPLSERFLEKFLLAIDGTVHNCFITFAHKLTSTHTPNYTNTFAKSLYSIVILI